MSYTLSEWTALSPQETQWAVEGLAKAKNIKVGRRVLLDSKMIGTTVREATVVRILANTSWDAGSRFADDDARFPDLQLNVKLVVESDQGVTMEVNLKEIVKILNR